tara:strand:- start:5556 stop:6140 length:585 start_codon:yes stop_codon:yes gene_type:complete
MAHRHVNLMVLMESFGGTVSAKHAFQGHVSLVMMVQTTPSIRELVKEESGSVRKMGSGESVWGRAFQGRRNAIRKTMIVMVWSMMRVDKSVSFRMVELLKWFPNPQKHVVNSWGRTMMDVVVFPEESVFVRRSLVRPNSAVRVEHGEAVFLTREALVIAVMVWTTIAMVVSMKDKPVVRLFLPDVCGEMERTVI